jgi:hypothetical protein
MNLAVLVLATSAALSAPIQYRYGNLLLEFEGRALQLSGISLGTLGRWIPILTSMPFVVVTFIDPGFPLQHLASELPSALVPIPPVPTKQ